VRASPGNNSARFKVIVLIMAMNFSCAVMSTLHRFIAGFLL
jgi:hypothetical protein